MLKLRKKSLGNSLADVSSLLNSGDGQWAIVAYHEKQIQKKSNE